MKTPIEKFNDLLSEPILMGITNVTPDSFSEKGKYFDSDFAIEHSLQLMNDGADIIDIGAESTRPNADSISEEEELKRIVPVVKGLLSESPSASAFISIDTTKSKIAEECIKLGAQMLNDISAGTFDERIFFVAAKYEVPIVLMHTRGSPKTMQNNTHYENIVSEIIEFLSKRIERAVSEGVKKIIIDPGIGFAKSLEDNYRIINQLEKFILLGYPIMIGVSRKSLIGNILNIPPIERDYSSKLLEFYSLLKGVSIIRTHNIKLAFEMKQIYSAIIKNNV